MHFCCHLSFAFGGWWVRADLLEHRPRRGMRLLRGRELRFSCPAAPQSPESGHPLAGHTHTDARRLSCFFRPKTFVEDAADKKSSTKQHQKRAFVWLFNRALWGLERCGNHHFPEMSRVGNLQRDHS